MRRADQLPAMEHFDIVIIGGGPGGLSCARVLAESGVDVLLLERKKNIGPKVCAGGITWDGLIQKVPEKLIERTFHEQFIFSSYQKICFKKHDPIIATIDRVNLGQWMAERARAEGAHIRSGWHVRNISENIITASDDRGRPVTIQFNHLVGADGSSSNVRRFLNIPSQRVGIGINYQVPGHYDHMEWHLNTSFFGNGYGWIFPHKNSISIGGYASRNSLTPTELNKRLRIWGETRGFKLKNHPARAETINYDYRGYRFGNIWLVGDAAGMASGLTGEGIQPAIISGEAVARKIIDPSYPAEEINTLVKKQKIHQRIIDLSAGNRTFCTLLMETLVLLLRLRLIDFQKHLSM